jgi:hypothetical protein
MGQISGATNTQKTIILAIAEGWRLREVDGRGWCLFQAGRERPFATVKRRTVEAMIEAGWLEDDTAPKGLGFRPATDLTADGRRYAEKLIRQHWAESYRWNPYDQTPPSPPDDQPRMRLAA